MIEGFTKAPAPTYSPTDLSHAKHLAKIVQAHQPGSRCLTTKWAADFRRLRVLDKAPATQVEATLCWYEENIGHTYTPMALSGATFRRKYTALQAAMARAGHTPGVVVDAAAATVAAHLAPLGWPPAMLPKLPQAAACALAAYRLLVQHLNGLPGPCGQAVAASMADPVSFVVGWYTQGHMYWAQQPEWRLEDLAWRPGHPLFLQQARKLAQVYTGQPRAWDTLVANS